jgi:di/tricarboxylate transporter
MLREVLIFLAALAGFASAVAAYLAIFHGETSVKEILSTAFAATIGLYCGRMLERKLIRG